MLSIVMCSRDERRFAAASAMYAAALAGVEHEIVRIADATGMCEGYNRGIARARGERLLLSHDDVELLADDLPARLDAHFARFDLFGIAGTTKVIGPTWNSAGIPWVFGQVAHDTAKGLVVHVFGVPGAAVANAQAVDGVLMGVTRDLCRALPFDQAITGWHLYDIEFSYRAHLGGWRCGIACDLNVLHFSRNPDDVYRSPEFVAPARYFMQKHQATLPPLPADWPQWAPAWAKVASREQIRQTMDMLVASTRSATERRDITVKSPD